MSKKWKSSVDREPQGELSKQEALALISEARKLGVPYEKCIDPKGDYTENDVFKFVNFY